LRLLRVIYKAATSGTNPHRLQKRRWTRKLMWIVGELALLSILWVNVLASDPPRAHLIGTTILSPANGSVVSTVGEISGETLCPSGLNGTVQIRLRHVATAKTWDWSEERWSDDSAVEFKAIEGTQTPWRILLPRLAEGRYEVECRTIIDSVSQRTSAQNRFLIDRTPPRISFFPLHDQQTIDDAFEISGDIHEPSEIRFSIWRLSREKRIACWTGKAWESASSNSTLRASSANGYWFPAAETELPKAEQIQDGTYLISATAHDRAGNEGRAAVTVHKTSLKQLARD
jgi:hypothetical protein